MSPLEQVFLGVGDVIRNENISVEYPRSASAEITAKSTCLEAEVAGAAPINTTQPNPPSGACEEPKAISGNIIRTVSEAEFEEIPRYMRGRMTRAELNEIVVKLDEFLMQKRRLLNAPFKKLSMKDKDQVGKWKEQFSILINCGSRSLEGSQPARFLVKMCGASTGGIARGEVPILYWISWIR
ncbi:hypothetical protein NECAME_01251 [Necator americanus]|uniref:SKA complex subunit 1 n=1 Tax=Necator americanus TaxID=51031 RepID=W2TYZ6_NECAM|nr:hypothetical protein NECAME_01251 [Necator americanus]ETN87093.1 hypothetical protein NECAME_01251 [Necator americanus]